MTFARTIIVYLFFGCISGLMAEENSPTQLTYELVASYHHDESAFTQGLFFSDGELFETTGLYGQSKLRKVDLDSGKPLKEVDLPKAIFGEGSTAVGNSIYVLSWRRGIALQFDKETLSLQSGFRYSGEGWGLAYDGDHLLMSDGSPQIRFLNPEDFSEHDRITVTMGGKPLHQINELEWIDGAIFANIWQTEMIVKIDPSTGQVTAIVDLTGLLDPSEAKSGKTDVLNGIAYDQATGRLFVTGKNWPKLFEIKLKQVSAQID